MTDRYSVCDTVLDVRVYPDRFDAACAAQRQTLVRGIGALRDEPTGRVAVRRFARIYEVEGELKGMSDERHAMWLTTPLWDKLKVRLELDGDSSSTLAQRPEPSPTR